MSNVFQYWVHVAAALVILALAVLYIRSRKDYTMYDFINVIIAALIPLTVITLAALLSYYLPVPEYFVPVFFWIWLPMRFANLSVFLFVLLGIAMAVSNIELMRKEGRSLKNAVGTLLQLVWIFATAAVYALMYHLSSLGGQFTEAGRIAANWLTLFLYCLIDYGECVMIGIIIMGWVAAHGHSVHDKDFIIIPGCSISKTGGLLPLIKGRVNRAIHYAWEQEVDTGKPVCYIPSGGQGADEIISEASAMELYLLSHSAENYEVYPEKRSVNTAENFLFSAEIVRQLKPDAKVAFATTNYHVLRCGMLAKRAGLIAEGIASSTKWYFWPNGFAREVIAIFAMTRRYHAAAAVVLILFSALLTCWGASLS